MDIVFEGEFTDLNRYIKALNNSRWGGASIKKIETERVYICCKNQKVKSIKDYPVFVIFTWYSKNLKMDIDNVAFAKKFILDGLVKAKVLTNDSRKFVSGFTDYFEIDSGNPRVVVNIISHKK